MDNLRRVVQAVVRKTIAQIEKEKEGFRVPAGVSARHIHISEEDLKTIFSEKDSLTVFKELSQPGQYACEEKVSIMGPNGIIKDVRILGPVRRQTQVEVSLTDCFELGINAPVRDSGDLSGSSPITLIGPSGVAVKKEGAIVAKNHLHLSQKDGIKYGLNDKDKVNVYALTERSAAFLNVLVRCGKDHGTEFHIDVDEANAACLKTGDFVKIVK